jgi:hypothetical protein
MSTKLEFHTPEGNLSISIADAEFMAYDAGEASIDDPRFLVERMRAMGLSELAEHHARLIAQNRVTVMELREAREDAEALLASGEPFEDTITPRLEVMRETITRTQLAMRASINRMAALSAACHQALSELPGYRPPARPRA